MTKHAFHILDVFTGTPFAGNPLAVVHDADGLDTAQCQRIAREFNLSETVFVQTPRDPINTAKVRIFTPTRELPFAGHPTVGAAVLIAQLRAPEMVGQQDLVLVLEQPIGAVECVVRKVKGVTRASFTLPRLPEPVGTAPSPADCATLLGLDETDVGFERHVPSLYSAGNPFCLVPLASRDALAQITPDLAAWDRLLPDPMPRAVFAYIRGGEGPGTAFRARMFAPGFGMAEDPATGSAVAAFAGAILQFEQPPDGDHTVIIEQGFEMGRPSLITLGLDVAGGALTGASIGGGAVIVAEGTLR